jgi:hypothetical protein
LAISPLHDLLSIAQALIRYRYCCKLLLLCRNSFYTCTAASNPAAPFHLELWCICCSILQPLQHVRWEALLASPSLSILAAPVEQVPQEVVILWVQGKFGCGVKIVGPVL